MEFAECLQLSHQLPAEQVVQPTSLIVTYYLIVDAQVTTWLCTVTTTTTISLLRNPTQWTFNLIGAFKCITNLWCHILVSEEHSNESNCFENSECHDNFVYGI